MPRTPFSKLPVQPNMEGWCLEKMGESGNLWIDCRLLMSSPCPTRVLNFCFMKKQSMTLPKGQIESWVQMFIFFQKWWMFFWDPSCSSWVCECPVSDFQMWYRCMNVFFCFAFTIQNCTTTTLCRFVLRTALIAFKAFYAFSLPGLRYKVGIHLEETPWCESE